MHHFRLRAAVALVCLLPAAVAMADPWLQPGDPTLRHDIELLADAGIIHSPVTTWPLSWPDIAKDVLGASAPPGASAALLDSLSRVQRAAGRAARSGSTGLGYRVSGAHEPTPLRTFSDTPREEGELELGWSWLGNRFAANANVTVVSDASDDQSIRLDGSYVGMNIGNFMISAGWMERWWGPGWEGSLILGNNARPIPSIRVERNYTDPFETKWLSWLGNWRASLELGQAEGSDVALADVRFLAARLNFKPLPWFEFGLSRTAQWCGEGRPCDFDTFTDLLIGNDNRDESLSAEDEPGNQMAGYDIRLSSPWKQVPLAFYAQFIGEDEAGGLPSKFLGLFGLEGWMSTAWGGLRMHVEYADTACSFTQKEPDVNCGYRNQLYPQGYTFRGRTIGHALDNDGTMLSLHALLVRPAGDSFSVLVRSIDINRFGPPDSAHTLSPTPRELDNIEIEYQRAFGAGHLRLGVGYDDYKDATVTDEDTDFRGFIEWRQNL